MQALAIFETQQATRHLNTLCHHFSRKVQTTCTQSDARIVFGFGQCAMAADDHHLKLWAKADAKGDLDTVIEVMTRHLERFAFRENPQLDWRPVSGSDPTPAL